MHLPGALGAGGGKQRFLTDLEGSRQSSTAQSCLRQGA